MNHNQRMQNRKNAEWLRHQQVCPECGERGLHYISAQMSIADILSGNGPAGFWTCPKFYGPDGRRLETTNDQ